eukprot:m.99414 g.99414  ORF g.99414 m.99414 type:complete len:264 (+) comp8719_c0_seq2:796-1587(+)
MLLLGSREVQKSRVDTPVVTGAQTSLHLGACTREAAASVGCKLSKARAVFLDQLRLGFAHPVQIATQAIKLGLCICQVHTGLASIALTNESLLPHSCELDVTCTQGLLSLARLAAHLSSESLELRTFRFCKLQKPMMHGFSFCFQVCIALLETSSSSNNAGLYIFKLPPKLLKLRLSLRTFHWRCAGAVLCFEQKLLTFLCHCSVHRRQLQQLRSHLLTFADLLSVLLNESVMLNSKSFVLCFQSRKLCLCARELGLNITTLF